MSIAYFSQVVLRASHTRLLFEAPENISREVLNQTLYELDECERPFLFPVLSQRQEDLVEVLNS